MQNMLVRLIDLPDIEKQKSDLLEQGIIFRHPIAPEKSILTDWVKANFSDYWASEVEVSFSFQPVHCIVAQQDKQPIGFACYETTSKNFFGPTGVLETKRGLGVGKVLLVMALQALKNKGYAYAIIGGVGPVEYYQKAVGATIIEGSENSIYNDLLKKNGGQ